MPFSFLENCVFSSQIDSLSLGSLLALAWAEQSPLSLRLSASGWLAGTAFCPVLSAFSVSFRYSVPIKMKVLIKNVCSQREGLDGRYTDSIPDSTWHVF